MRPLQGRRLLGMMVAVLAMVCTPVGADTQQAMQTLRGKE